MQQGPVIPTISFAFLCNQSTSYAADRKVKSPTVPGT